MPIFILMLAPTAPAVSLQDFGYLNMNVNGQVAPAHRPLLVILANFGTRVPISHNAAFYDSLIFDFNHPLTSRNLNLFFLENSNNRFFWSRGGIIGPFQLPESQSFTNYPGGSTGPGFYSNIVAQAILSGYDFKQYDANSDNVIAQDELQIMIITDDYDTYGTVGGRPAGQIHLPGFNFTVNAGTISTLFDGLTGNIVGASDFFTFCHESCHTLGTIDVYGYGIDANQSQFQSTMSAGFFESIDQNGADGMKIVHLDPWQKMQLGWCEPRILSIHSGGLETIPAVQMVRPDAPVLLYDPARGSNEFFLLEYRTADSPNGSGYDSDVAGNGLVVWHISQDGNHHLLLLPNNTQNDWSEAPPNFQHPSHGVWTNTSLSAYLQWQDGTQTVTRFRVLPFNYGDGSITVELLAGEDTWVDFSWGTPNSGAFSTPYNTFSNGVAHVSYGGNLNFKTGLSHEAMTIAKPMSLKAYNGPVLIGH